MQAMIEIAKRHVPKDGFVATLIPSLQIVRCSAPSEPVPAVYRPSFCYVLQGSKELTVSGRTFRYSEGQYMVSSVDLPVTGEITRATAGRPYLCLVVSIEPPLIYDVLQNHTPAGRHRIAGGNLRRPRRARAHRCRRSPRPLPRFDQRSRRPAAVDFARDHLPPALRPVRRHDRGDGHEREPHAAHHPRHRASKKSIRRAAARHRRSRGSPA